MYTPKHYVRLDSLTKPPQVSDLRRILGEAEKAKGCTVELPWSLPTEPAAFSLTVRVELAGGEPIWTLYEGDGPDSQVTWSSPFSDLELLYDVLSLTAPQESKQSQLPAEVRLANPVRHEQNLLQGASSENSSPARDGLQANANSQPIQFADPAGLSEHFKSDQSIDLCSTAATVPITPGPPPSVPQLGPLPIVTPDLELLRKAPNILLGHFLVESGLVPEPTMHAALRLQELVRQGYLSCEQAAQAAIRAHERGGVVDSDLDSQELIKLEPVLNKVGTPLGEILVEAGLISGTLLDAALKLQEVVRSGNLTKEDACKALYSKYFGATASGAIEDSEEDSPQTNGAIRLLVKSGIIGDQDVIRARNVSHKHGGKISKILIAAGKIDQKVLEAASEAEALLATDQIKLEQAIIALHYCQRSRSLMSEALEDLGWGKP